MKILQVLHSFLPYSTAGTEVYAYSLSKELNKSHKLAIFFRINDIKLKEFAVLYNRFEGIDTYAINHTLRYCASFSDTYMNKEIDMRFAEIVEEIRPDVIHVHHLLFLSRGIITEAKKRNIPVIFTLHDYALFCYRGQLIDHQLNICDGDDLQKCSECLKYILKIKKYSLYIYHFLRKIKALILLSLGKKLYFLFTGKKKTEALACFEKSKEYIFSEVDLFIAPSQFIKNKFLEQGIKKEKITYSAYGINKNTFLNNSFKNKNPNLIKFAFLGTLLPTKGPDLLIRAFRQITNRNIILLIYGKLFPYVGFEFYPNLLKKIAGRDSRIKFNGEYRNEDVGKILSGIDALIVPSIWQENSPLVIHEAFLSGTPVIASRIGGIPELIKDKINGLLFKPGDNGDLKAKIEYLINHPEQFDKFRKNFPVIKSIEENTRELEEIYARIAKNGSR